MQIAKRVGRIDLGAVPTSGIIADYTTLSLLLKSWVLVRYEQPIKPILLARAASGNSARMIGMSSAKTGAQDAASSNAFRLPVFAFAGQHPILEQAAGIERMEAADANASGGSLGRPPALNATGNHRA